MLNQTKEKFYICVSFQESQDLTKNTQKQMLMTCFYHAEGNFIAV